MPVSWVRFWLSRYSKRDKEILKKWILGVQLHALLIEGFTAESAEDVEKIRFYLITDYVATSMEHYILTIEKIHNP